ncbi:hypothetical protein [Nocardia sp.]|uniref:hypothetical protein n=1 Tax=Nocardia sp. TaxID=1821 RepID=UPI002625418D|nr:hypothetical protein [Nocardia sp.]
MRVNQSSARAEEVLNLNVPDPHAVSSCAVLTRKGGAGGLRLRVGDRAAEI